MTTTVEALDLPMAFSWGGPAASADIYVAPAFGVPPVTPSLGTFLPANLGGWIPFVTTTPVPVAGGGAYAVVLRAIPPQGSTTWCSALQYDPVPAQPLPYQFTGASCPTTLPPSGMIAGSPFVPGSSCLHYLDSLSLTTLFASGLEPLAQVAPPTNQNVTLGYWYP